MQVRRSITAFTSTARVKALTQTSSSEIGTMLLQLLSGIQVRGLSTLTRNTALDRVRLRSLVTMALIHGSPLIRAVTWVFQLHQVTNFTLALPIQTPLSLKAVAIAAPIFGSATAMR